MLPLGEVNFWRVNHFERTQHRMVSETEKGIYCYECRAMLKKENLYEVAIATSTYFNPYGNLTDGTYRLRLFQQLIQSLTKLDTLGKRVVWVIHDDASEYFPEIPEMPFDVRVLKRKTNWGQPDNYHSTVAEARLMADWIVVIDDDGFVAPDALKRAFDLVARYPNSEVYGLFNTKYHANSQEFEDHVLKGSICEMGRMFRCDFDGMNGIVQHDIPVLRPSGIQHCGKFGLNGTQDDVDLEVEFCRA